MANTHSSSSSSSSSSHQNPKASLHTIDSAIENHLSSSPAAAQLLPAALAALAWLFDAQQTFINVFADAVPPFPCSSPALLALPSSSFFFGCLAGGFLLATLGDSRIGRKNMLVLSSFIMSLSAALTAAAPSLLAYAALRFVCGFGRATVGTSALVLSTEHVSRRWRDRVSIVGFFCFTLGFLSLPIIAYVARGESWRLLYVLTAAPAFVYTVVVYFTMKESPRWLLLKGRRGEAIEAIKKMRRSGGDDITGESFSNLALLEHDGSGL